MPNTQVRAKMHLVHPPVYVCIANCCSASLTVTAEL